MAGKGWTAPAWPESGLTTQPVGERLNTKISKGGRIGVDPLRGAAVSFLGILLLAAATSGQNPLPSGNLYGTALDPEGKSVPGVTVTLQGPGAPQSATTDLNGDFRFLYLSPGKYSLTLERVGFAPVRRDVDVTLGGNAVLSVTLAVAGAEETVTVSGGSPALDSRETETGATFERKELDTIPTTRDPWTILRQVPGVLVANMNVNGADTGNASPHSSERARTPTRTPTTWTASRSIDPLLRLRLSPGHRGRHRRLRPRARDAGRRR